MFCNDFFYLDKDGKWMILARKGCGAKVKREELVKGAGGVMVCPKCGNSCFDSIRHRWPYAVSLRRVRVGRTLV